MNLAKPFAALHIDLAYLDVTFLPKEIALVALEVECGVATADGKVNHDGFRPFASGIISPHIEMTARWKDRCHHVESSVVVSDGGSIDAAVAIGAFQVHLGWSCQAVAYLFPVHQILAVEYRHSWEVLECAVYEIEVITCTAHAWIGVEARKHRIYESLTKGAKRL